jgi:hypothetical protein
MQVLHGTEIAGGEALHRYATDAWQDNCQHNGALFWFGIQNQNASQAGKSDPYNEDQTHFEDGAQDATDVGVWPCCVLDGQMR